MEIWTALAIGFFGSFHCVGMCGPIALALPGKKTSGTSYWIGRILYNLGRIITYGTIGAIFGLVGQSIAFAGFQKSLSIVLGTLIILGVLLNKSSFLQAKKKINIESFFGYIKKSISAQFKKSGIQTLLIIGLLNGLLPCGFVYVGLAGSLTTGTIAEGALYMTFFGLGTFPAMFAMSIAPGFFSISIRQRINKIIPVLTILFGLYLIYRGIAVLPLTH